LGVNYYFYQLYGQTLINYNVSNNKDKFILTPLKNNWHATKLNQSIKLEKGICEISFTCKAPYVPEIEFIVLSKNPENVEISEKKYNDYISKIKEDINNLDSGEENFQDSSLNVKWSNPEGNYPYRMNVPFSYTYYTKFYVGYWDRINLKANGPSSYSYVMEVFHKDDPSSKSKSVKSDKGVASIKHRFYKKGYYYVRIRAYKQNTLSSVNLYKDGDLYAGNCPVSGNGFRSQNLEKNTFNFFSTYLTGDARIWIEKNGDIPGDIIAYNDDYVNSNGYFNWRYNSRVKKYFKKKQVGATLISSFGSYNPTGKADLYMGCKNSDVYSGGFPLLKADDAIMSASSSSAYNCASWAGGRTDLGRYFWASGIPNSQNHSSPWYSYNNFWKSWDNYFGNTPKRYTGAIDYSRSNPQNKATAVAMWYNNTDYSYTHFSVIKPANYQPHGYDWESKPGGNTRTFHPKNALKNNNSGGYGQIKLYYYPINNKEEKYYTFEQSVAMGLTVLPEIFLTKSENEKINNLTKKISAEKIDNFNKLFSELLIKCETPEMKMHSNPVYLYKTDDYITVMNFCKKNKETILPLLYKKVFFGDDVLKRELAAVFVNEITPEYGDIIEDVKATWAKNCYTKTGAYIVPSSMSNTKNYIKRLLKNYTVENVKSGNTKDKTASIKMINIYKDNEDVFFVYPNPVKDYTNFSFNLNEVADVSISIYNLPGKLISYVFSETNKAPGDYKIKWNTSNVKTGLYICRLTINNKIYTRRIFKEE